MEKVVIYARVSTTDQTTENQILKLRTIVEKNDWELTEIYVDEGISGAKGTDIRIPQKKIKNTWIPSHDGLLLRSHFYRNAHHPKLLAAPHSSYFLI